MFTLLLLISPSAIFLTLNNRITFLFLAHQLSTLSFDPLFC
jgi:hypothetical protein